MTIRVLLVDDEHAVREGFRLILQTQPDIKVVGEADNGQAAVDEAIRLSPDVVLMDIKMREVDGLEATRTLMKRMVKPPRIVILTTFDYDEYVYEALRAGASAFLLKDSPPEQLAAAVRVVQRGDSLLHPAVTRRMIAEYVRRPRPESGRPAELSRLTDREVQVMELVAKGLTNAEIAARLFLGEATVKTYVGNLLSKLGARDRIQVVVYAYEIGLVQPGAAD